MITFSPDAQQLFDRYIETVRWSVRGTTDQNEIERDVREHVTSALEGREEPISSPTLREVLSRLGEPWEWIPAEDLPVWRRIVMRFSVGPEDWRLTYLCFSLTILGILLAPVGIGIVLLIGAALLARATCELANDRKSPLGARRWLIYPPIVVFALIISVALVVGPAGPMIGWGIGRQGFSRAFESARFNMRQPVEEAMFYAASTAIVVGSWWLILSAIVAIAYRPLKWILVPLSSGLRRRHALWIGLVGLGLLVLGAGTILAH